MSNKVADKISNYFEMVEKSNQLMGKANDILSGGPKSFYFERLREYAEALFEKYAPFKEGDRVEISAEIDTDNGWFHHSHFLKEGEQGLVMEVDYYKNKFFVTVVFDNTSWISSTGPDKGKINPIPFKERGGFCIGEDKLTLIKQPDLS